MQISLNEAPRSRPGPQGWSPLALGFRPFFLLAGLAALVLLLLWLGLWHHPMAVEGYYGRIGWHSHEMLFGYTLAVIAGFLLTAVRNWTGIETPKGIALAGLALIWLLARILPWIPSIPPGLTAVLDLIFLPCLILALAKPLWMGANKANRVFFLLLGGMFLANLLIHAQALGWATGTAARGTELMMNLVLLTLLLVTGRVMPFFTEKAVAASRPRVWPWLERSGFALLSALTLAQLFGLGGWPVALLAFALAITQGWRLWGWYHPGVWPIPILWVLYTGYAWLVMAFVFLGLTQLGLFPPSLTAHAFTLGAFGVLTLGMMARVALGHTGRPMRSASAMNLGFVLMNVATTIRVFAVYLAPKWYLIWIILAGALWLVAFAIFLAIYTPILLRPRIDGRPG